MTSPTSDRPARDSVRPARRPPVQHVLTVQRTEQLSPHLIRVHLGGPGFPGFVASADPARLAATDTYVKILLARPELGLVPPYDLDELRGRLDPADLPVRRTYTVRSVDVAAGTLAIDFVVHGTEGVAGPWAVAARPGDLLALSSPGGQYAPTTDPEVEHLLVGDDTAIPAIAAALTAMPPTASGRAIIEVDSAADVLPLQTPSRLVVTWLYRGVADGTVPGEPLVAAVRALPRPAGPVQVFAHGERSSMQTIGRILTGDWGLDRRTLSLSAYWALGRTEDRFQDEKREPIGQIFTD